MQAPARVNSDHYRSARSTPLPVSRPAEEDVVLPSIESAPPSPRHLQNRQHAGRYDTSSAHAHYSDTQAVQSRKRPAYAEPLRDDHAEKRLREVHYEEAPARPSQSSKFQRMHSRNAAEMQSRSRVQLSSYDVNTYRPSAADRDGYVPSAPADNYSAARSNSSLHYAQPLPAYASHLPEDMAAGRYALRRYEPVEPSRGTYLPTY